MPQGGSGALLIKLWQVVALVAAVARYFKMYDYSTAAARSADVCFARCAAAHNNYVLLLQVEST